MDETVTLSQNATMVAYLMEAGWKLHLSSNRYETPTIWKSRRDGANAKVDSCDVSHDVVLELQQAGLLERDGEFECGDETVTVFVHS